MYLKLRVAELLWHGCGGSFKLEVYNFAESQVYLCLCTNGVKIFAEKTTLVFDYGAD